MAEHDHTPTPSTPVTRRVLALGAGAFSAIGITAGAAASVAEPHPDAEVIRTAAELVAIAAGSWPSHGRGMTLLPVRSRTKINAQRRLAGLVAAQDVLEVA